MGISEELVREIAELAARMDAATHRLLTCIRQLDVSDAWAEQGAVSCAHWLSWRIGLDLGTAREKVRVARALGGLPRIDEAFRLAKLSYAKVRAMTRVATPANEEALLEVSLSATGAQLERICRACRQARAADQPPSAEERSVRRRELPGGMIKLELVLSPDEADLVMRAIDCGRAMDAEKQKAKDGKVSAETPPEQSWPSRADGLVTVAAGYLAGNAGTDSGGDRYQVMVHVDQDPLGPDGSQAVTLDDGSRISAETLRRVACDCGLVAVAGDSPLNVGRRTRSIPPAIRRALHLRDHGCRFPGCRNQRFLHGHHVVHWLHGGETSIDNLIQLCSHHHRLVHEGGWSIVRAEDGTWTFVAPSGQGLVNEAREAWHGRIVGWLQEWSDKHQLALGPDTNEPLWDGEPPNYDEAVGGLLRLG